MSDTPNPAAQPATTGSSPAETHQVFFSNQHVHDVAEQLRQYAVRYEQLFDNLAKQIYVDIKDADSDRAVVERCLARTESALETFKTVFADKAIIACQKGCGHCCNFPVVSPPQVIVDIANHLKATRSAEEIDQLRQRMDANIEARQPPWFRAPCPLLDDEKSCSIYSHRPLACRAFSSPDVNACIESVNNGRQINQHPVSMRVYEAATTALMAAAPNCDEQLPLIPTLLALLDPAAEAYA